MSKIKYDTDSISLIALFESMTGAKVKDCIASGKLIFIIEENEMGRAIGSNGNNIRRVENALKKKIKLVEFSNDVLKFVRNLLYPMEVMKIEIEKNIVTIYEKDTGTKAMLIGRERQNINQIYEITKRYFKIDDIKVA